MSDLLSRRATLAAPIGIGLAAMTGSTRPAGAANSAPARLPYTDPIWNREAAARLQAHTSGKQVFGSGTGLVCGVRPGEAVRTLFGFEVFSTIRVLRQADGSYQRLSREVVFYTDPTTGTVLEKWHNPYTGEDVRVVDVANDPYNWVISDTVQPPPIPGTPSTGRNVPGGKPYLLHWKDYGADTVVLAETFHGYYPNKLDPAKWPRESAGKMAQASELFRYFIDRKTLADPAADHVPHLGSWVRITPWLPWMLMGQATGHIMYDGVFRPYETTEYYSPSVMARVHAKYPQYLTAPDHWYGPSLSSLEHYALEQTPAK